MLEKIEPMEFIEDDEIIRLFHERKREQEAFRLLVNKYKERLYWHIRKIVINHDDTDDLLQNVFVKIWQGLQEFRNDSKLYTWMYRIATNESLNFLNEKSRKVYGNSDEISVYLEKGMAKMEIALAKGKDLHDKRNVQKEKDAKREIEKAMKNQY